jgi:hypothetical protein
MSVGTVVETPTDAIREFAPLPIQYDSSESNSASVEIAMKFLTLISFGLIGSHTKEGGVQYESGGMTQHGLSLPRSRYRLHWKYNAKLPPPSSTMKTLFNPLPKNRRIGALVV